MSKKADFLGAAPDRRSVGLNTSVGGCSEVLQKPREKYHTACIISTCHQAPTKI